jgi:hypothetical protein
MNMAGYSEKDLNQKLGLKNGMDVLFINPIEDYDKLIDLPSLKLNIKAQDAKDLDLVHFFTESFREYFSTLPFLVRQIKPEGVIWVSWPKKTSRLMTDLDENKIRDYALTLGLVDIKVCAVDENWSGLKLVIRKENR